jgi:S1-C subfamily serine protease
MRLWAAALLVCAMGSVALADEASTLLAATAKKAQDGVAVATVRYKIQGQYAGGSAVCIGADGTFLTMSIQPGMQQAKAPATGAASQPAAPGMMEELEVMLPGPDHKTIKADLLSTDQMTGLSFVRVRDDEGKTKFSPVQFAKSSGLKVGDLVTSLGIMPGDVAFSPYVGAAYISVELRVPDRIFYVTGGKLTSACSAVFNAKGEAVGLVFEQSPLMMYQTPGQQGLAEVGLRGRQEREFFVPVEEFAHALADPTKVRKLPWLGVLQFEAVEVDGAPAMKLGRVLAGQPAYAAGLRDGDQIRSVNGRKIEKLGAPELTARAFNRQLMLMNPGDKLTIVARPPTGESDKTAEVTLGAEPTTPAAAPKYGNGRLGLLVRDKVLLDDYLLPGLSATARGVVVMAVIAGGLSEELQAGDVITSVDGKAVTTVQEFQAAVEPLVETGKTVTLAVTRGEKELPAVRLTVPAVGTRPATTNPLAPAGGRP